MLPDSFGAERSARFGLKSQKEVIPHARAAGNMPTVAGNMPALPKTRLSSYALPLSLASRTEHLHVPR